MSTVEIALHACFTLSWTKRDDGRNEEDGTIEGTHLCECIQIKQFERYFNGSKIKNDIFFQIFPLHLNIHSHELIFLIPFKQSAHVHFLITALIPIEWIVD